MVRAVGFEPTASRIQVGASTRLTYALMYGAGSRTRTYIFRLLKPLPRPIGLYQHITLKMADRIGLAPMIS